MPGRGGDDGHGVDVGGGGSGFGNQVVPLLLTLGLEVVDPPWLVKVPICLLEKGRFRIVMWFKIKIYFFVIFRRNFYID